MRDMTEGSPVRHVVRFAIPMVLGSIFQQLYNSVDSIVIGRYEGANALAAVGSVFPAMFFVLSIAIGLTMGIQVIISQLFGAGDHERLRRTVSTSVISLGILVAVATFAGRLGVEPLLRVTNTPPEIFADAATYLDIIFQGIIFAFFYNLYTAMLRGIGDSKTPLYFLFAAAIVNVVLDIYFVVNLGMGVSGVAIATNIAQAVSAVLCVIYVHFKVPLLRITLKELVFDKEIFKDILRFGVPTAVQQSVSSLGMMAVVNLVNSFGAVTMAAYTAGNKIESFVMMPIMNIGGALSTFVGQNVGAGKMDRAQTGYRSVLKINVAMTIVLSLAIIPTARYLIMIFVRPEETQVIAIGTEYLATMFSFYVPVAVIHCMAGFFRGTGDMKSAMAVSLITLGVRVVAAYIMAPFPAIGYRSIWFSMPCGWLVACAYGYYVYRSGSWAHYAIACKEEAEPLDVGEVGV